MRIGKILNFFDSLKSLKISSLQTKKASITLTFIFVIPLGLEPKTYCLEGSCSIQLSYGTSLLKPPCGEIGCKGRYFFRTYQIFT